jgi:HPt (histidine-containing phosphotransfer) domain-containing protein
MFRNIGEDTHLFAQLVEMFLTQHPAMLADIKEGLIRADSVVVERTAHTLKGTAGNLCAPEVVLAASRLEAIGHLGSLQDAPPIYAQLEQEVLRLVQALGPFRQGYTPLPQAA